MVNEFEDIKLNNLADRKPIGNKYGRTFDKCLLRSKHLTLAAAIWMKLDIKIKVILCSDTGFVFIHVLTRIPVDQQCNGDRRLNETAQAAILHLR